jgi:single-strand DNA-binding protein
MRGLNKLFIFGRLGNQPERKLTSNGHVFTILSIATERNIKSGDEYERVTDWHRITVWGKLADLCLKHLYVGCDIGVEGQLQVDSWVNKKGEKRSRVKIVAEHIHFGRKMKQAS